MLGQSFAEFYEGFLVVGGTLGIKYENIRFEHKEFFTGREVIAYMYAVNGSGLQSSNHSLKVRGFF